MTFSEQLNEYIEQMGCSAKELADASGLSASVVSRYRAGTRAPERHSEQFEQIVRGLALVAEAGGHTELTAEIIQQALAQTLEGSSFPYEQFQKNLDFLLTELSVNVVDLARTMNFDSSYISRIRNGQRKPADPEQFATGVAGFVTNRLTSSDRETVAKLLDCTIEQISSDGDCIKQIVHWLSNGQPVKKDVVIPFLTKLDEFDLNDFIRSIRFDELKAPTVPFQLPVSKNYYGLDEMRKGTLEFFKLTVLSKLNEDIIANDDTPMADKAAGTDFMKHYIFAVALALKKGLHINFIHNINRPFDEMMMGLEGWIPMYMTGQISPYYLKGVHNKLFGHFLYSSGAAALSGECIMDYHQNGKMYLTNHKTELEYYRQRAKDLLSKASPLMDIYRLESADKFKAFTQKDITAQGKRRAILSALPIHTMSEELLLRILDQNKVGRENMEIILAHATEKRSQYEAILSRDTIIEEIPVLGEDEFAEHPMYLPLSGIFYEKDIAYTYEDYLEHMEQIQAYCAEHENYTVKHNRKSPFRNIQIYIHEGEWVIVSKSKAPAIHFVIHNPQLRSAIENMVVPVFEDNEEQ